jgi:hypothetical protein
MYEKTTCITFLDSYANNNTVCATKSPLEKGKNIAWKLGGA